MNDDSERVPIRIGNETIGWLYTYIPPQDPNIPNDRATPVAIYIPKHKTRRN